MNGLRAFFSQDRCEPNLKVMNIMTVNIKFTKAQNIGIRGILFEGKTQYGFCLGSTTWHNEKLTYIINLDLVANK